MKHLMILLLAAVAAATGCSDSSDNAPGVSLLQRYVLSSADSVPEGIAYDGHDAAFYVTSLQGASIRTNAAWKSVRMVDDGNGEEIEVLTASGERLRVDYLIVAIGFVQDFQLRREMSDLVGDIALWRDRFSPPQGEADAQMSSHPYLGRNFEFQERTPGTAPHLSRIFNFTYSALVSMGLSGSAISGFRYSLPRLVDGITRSLFLEDAETIYEQFSSYAEPEMLGTVPFQSDVSRAG